MLENLPTPTVLLDLDRTDTNIRRMQDVCDRNGVELWPHAKTHKMVEVACRQLKAGARGLVCAKLGEAEALIPSGVSRIFLAHSLVDPIQSPRIQKLAGALDELILAVTSAEQAEALDDVLRTAALKLPVMMAVDTGLHREGARTVADAVTLAAQIRRSPRMLLQGVYTHEGQAYSAPREQSGALIESVHDRLIEVRDAIDPALKVWPGCSVTAERMAALPGVDAVRPGAYVFGDLYLSRITGVMSWESLAITVLSTVVDHPEPGLTLIDAGSKTFSGDKGSDGVAGADVDGKQIFLMRCNEEHGYVIGDDAAPLHLRDRVRLVPAHVCPVINLTDQVTVIQNGGVIENWTVEARGKVS